MLGKFSKKKSLKTKVDNFVNCDAKPWLSLSLHNMID